MRRIIPLLFVVFATICYAEEWVYTGSATEFIPVSSELGAHWKRSVIRIINEQNELKHFFDTTCESNIGITTDYELFRRNNGIREFSDVAFTYKDSATEKQTYQLFILLFEHPEGLDQYWDRTHLEHLTSTVFSATIDGHQCCIFRLQNVYVRTSSRASIMECERISGVVFNQIQRKQKEAEDDE